MHVPKVYHFEPEQAATVIAYLSPHSSCQRTNRRVVYPRLADHLSIFLAEMLFAHRSRHASCAKKVAQPCYARTPPYAKSAKTSSSRTPIELLPSTAGPRPNLTVSRLRLARCPTEGRGAGAQMGIPDACEALLHAISTPGR